MRGLYQEEMFKWSDYTVEKVKERTAAYVKGITLVISGLAAGPTQSATLESTFWPLMKTYDVYRTQQCAIELLAVASPNDGIRSACADALKEIGNITIEVSMNQAIFDKLLYLRDSDQLTGVTSELRRSIEFMIADGKRNGLHLDKELQEQVKAFNVEENELILEYRKNRDDSATVLEFTDKQLIGIPEDLLQSLDKTEEGLYIVTMKYPHYIPCMQNCHNPETRQTLSRAFNSRCIDNNPALLKKTVDVRLKRAKLLGYPSHAAFKLEDKMAKNPETVQKFISELADKLRPLSEQEFEKYKELKKEMCVEHGFEYDGKINEYDVSYCQTLYSNIYYSIDRTELKQYFEMGVVLEGILNIYQLLLGLKFERITDADVWHDDVKLYSASDADSGTLLGYFYLDMHPRDGKFPHARCMAFQKSYYRNNGESQLAVIVLICNLTGPSGDRPALLDHDEVKMFFHEFGHAMHGICSRTETPYFSGEAVVSDFVEAPSQMLENWCWTKEPLKLLSKHIQTGEPLSDELCEKLSKARVANAGSLYLKTLMLARFDMALHSDHPVEDIRECYSQLSQQICGYPLLEGTDPSATFGHIMHLSKLYDAGFYAYKWSEVFSVDMFVARFGKDGCLNVKTGREYREKILQPGGTVDAIDLLKEFIGREPNQEAFLKNLGL